MNTNEYGRLVSSSLPILTGGILAVRPTGRVQAGKIAYLRKDGVVTTRRKGKGHTRHRIGVFLSGCDKDDVANIVLDSV